MRGRPLFALLALVLAPSLTRAGESKAARVETVSLQAAPAPTDALSVQIADPASPPPALPPTPVGIEGAVEAASNEGSLEKASEAPGRNTPDATALGSLEQTGGDLAQARSAPESALSRLFDFGRWFSGPPQPAALPPGVERGDPDPTPDVLSRDVVFVPLQAGKAIRAQQGDPLYLWFYLPATVIATTTDGRRLSYRLRYTGIGKINDAYLPPNVERFTIRYRDPKLGPREIHRKVDRAARPKSVRRGKPWLDWLDERLKPGSPVLADRAALYGFVSSLFRLDWDTPALAGNAALKGLPRGARPDDEAAALILRRLGERWDELGLAQRHGSLDYWIALAATAPTQAPSTLWRATRLIESLGRPAAELYLLKMVAVHLRGLPGHPVEYYGDPGHPREGFVDAAIMAELVPRVVDAFLRRYQDQPAAPGPRGSISERAYWLWTIATALDPNVFEQPQAPRLFGRRFDHRRDMLAGLDRLGRREELARLYEEILRTRWSDHGLRQPWLALAVNQPADTNRGNPGNEARLSDPRPIRLFGATSDADVRADPALLNTKALSWKEILTRRPRSQPEAPEAMLLYRARYRRGLERDLARLRS